jgi:hypothetical protein
MRKAILQRRFLQLHANMRAQGVAVLLGIVAQNPQRATAVRAQTFNTLGSAGLARAIRSDHAEDLAA